MAPTPLHHQLHEHFLVCMLLLMICSSLCARAQLDIIAITPNPDSEYANTILGTAGSVVASALLPVGTVAMLWGVVPSSAVIAACELIVNTGQHSFTANISNDSWGGSEYLTLQVLATGGCLAESDASGTQFSLIDNYDRYSAVVCPSDAGSVGCGVYMTGGDIDTIYNSWYGGSNLHLLHPTTAESRILLGNLQDPITATVTGVMTAANCTELGGLAPFCSPGALGAQVSPTNCHHCLENCNCPSCFPGDALVQTRHGIVIPMSQLQLGDQIAVLGSDGAMAYDDVYAFGHKDVEVLAVFTKIIAEPYSQSIDDDFGSDHVYSTNITTTLRLSAHHFIPSSTSFDGNKAPVYKRAKDIQVGDIIWATYGRRNSVKHVLLSRVKDISTTWGRGLYNPLTLSGTIIVDDVVASAHSDWFLDRAFDTIGLTHWLPATYQFVLAPIRGLYQMMGKTTYIFLYDKVDAYFDIPRFGTKYGGRVALGACATLISAPLIMRLVVPTKKP